MCGIAGVLNRGPAAPPIERERLRAMAGAIRNRGPDDEGFYLDPAQRCGLAFRRLSIIDLSTGAQPICNEDRTLWLVFNGEIYNYRALRDELRRAGHSFASESDSEVIVHAYEQWGVGCFPRLHGMFAIALWDERRARLVLARDRFGKKPLYIHHSADRLHFASEVKAIRAAAGLSFTLNPQAVHDYLVMQYVPREDIFIECAALPPGCFAEIDFGGAGDSVPPAGERWISPQRYYEVPTPRTFAGTYADAKTRLGELLTAAVQKRLMSDVPLGAFLSGGIDSSIIVGLMRRLGVSPLRTFSIGFEDPRYNEAPHARSVAEHFHTEHHERIVTPDAQSIFDELAALYDVPFADSSAIPTLLLSRFARESVTVALTGDAGDECFGGYDRYRAADLAARFDFVPAPLRKLAGAAAAVFRTGQSKTLRSRAFRFLRAIGRPAARRYADWVGVFDPLELARGYQPAFAAQIDVESPLRAIADWYDAWQTNPSTRAAFVDFHSYLPGDLLTKVDRASMSAGLECRSPFLDDELVEFALSLPAEWKVDARGGKRILRDWAAGLLPPDILTREKMGFGVPIGEWFRGPLREVLKAALLAPDGICLRLFQHAWLRELLDGHLESRANHAHRLWALFMLDRWSRRWL